MDALKDELIELEARKREIVERLKHRLEDINRERVSILQKLAELEGTRVAPVDPNRGSRSAVGKCIADVISEAGTEGISANEIVEEVTAVLPDTQRPCILTHISRMKKKGTIIAVGPRGSSVYVMAEELEGA